MFKPSVIAFDVETALLDGSPSIEYWRDDFRVTSAAFAWRTEDGSVKTHFCETEPAIEDFLVKCEDIPLIVHNFCFEYGVCLYRFPKAIPNIRFDTMRMALVADGGGDEAEKYAKKQDLDSLLDELNDEYKSNYGLGLEKCCNRWLGAEFQNHKQEAHKWLRENGVGKGKEGENLHLLPHDIFKRYNIADAENTLYLYEEFCNEFKRVGYDWTFDHKLYVSKCKLISSSRGEGVPIDRDKLKQCIDSKEEELRNISDRIGALHPKEIKILERKLRNDAIKSRKTLKGKKAILRRMKDLGKDRFNPGSPKQKAYLFCNLLGMETPFTTPKGMPSFKKTHLHVFGDAGEVLHDRGTIKIAKKQAENMILMSEKDNKVHFGLNPVGTATGRLSGGSNMKE